MNVLDYRPSSSTYVGTHGVLELCLKDVLSLIKPSESDRVKRINTMSELSNLIGSVESLKGAAVRPFGSFVSNLYTRWGDLDISVEVSYGLHISSGRRHKQNLLRDIVRALRRTGVAHFVNFIPNARVPVLKYESKYQNISCDISVDNHMGRIKSKILLWISDMDERFRDMVLLTKEWAKAQNINDPKCGTLNSYSLCLLIIFHLQTCKPAILPPLKEIYRGNIVNDVTGMRFVTEKNIEDVCAANVARFQSRDFSKRNQSSLCQLLISFFDKFSRIETLAKEYAISTYTGQWEYIHSKPRWTEKSYNLLIEDPFDQPDNAARAVGSRELSMISNAFMVAHRQLSSHSVLLDRNSLLGNLVRPNIRLQLATRNQGHYSSPRGIAHSPEVRFSGSQVTESTRNQILDGVRHRQPSSTYIIRREGAADESTRNQIQDGVRHRQPSSTFIIRREGAVDVPNQLWRPRFRN